MRISPINIPTESYLVLNKTCGYINRTYPQLPFFSIHDGILTTEEYSIKVKDVFMNVVSVLTDKDLKISVKENNKKIDIDETWTKININSKDKFERRKFSISKFNIEKGLSLISDQELKSKVKEVTKPYMKNFHS